MSKIQENNAFQYTYSAGNQEEIKQIRSKYLPREENKLERLRELDAGVTQKATMYSLVVGIIGMAVLAMAYPLYNCTIKKERERIAPEVLRLTEDLMK